ncbi:hypothetical protein B0H13DRAFT_1877712 [Mycena leptocephala]|nr:hypothetical protein B0H13DRAFT_1877712 [Mycena leptocephala]
MQQPVWDSGLDLDFEWSGGARCFKARLRDAQQGISWRRHKGKSKLGLGERAWIGIAESANELFSFHISAAKMRASSRRRGVSFLVLRIGAPATDGNRAQRRVVLSEGAEHISSFEERYDIENNPANYAKVVGTVQDSCTQLRAKFKKALFASLKIFVDGTQCTVTIELCARVTPMGSVFLQDCGPKFWENLDDSLAAIRSEAAFRHILTKDQNEHSIKDYEISDASVDNFQQEVDGLIDAGTTDLAEEQA